MKLYRVSQPCSRNPQIQVPPRWWNGAWNRQGFDTNEKFFNLMQHMDISRGEVEVVFNVLSGENGAEVDYMEFCHSAEMDYMEFCHSERRKLLNSPL